MEVVVVVVVWRRVWCGGRVGAGVGVAVPIVAVYERELSSGAGRSPGQ